MASIFVVLLTLSTLGGSFKDKYVKQYAWSISSYDKGGEHYTTYYGGQHVVQDGQGFHWTECKDETYCDICEEAGQNALKGSFVAFVACFVMLSFSVCRWKKEWEATSHKISVLVACVFAAVTEIIAMAMWHNGCVLNLPQDGTTYSLGDGFNCIMASIFVVLLLFVLTLLMPITKSGTDQALADGKLRQSANYVNLSCTNWGIPPAANTMLPNQVPTTLGSGFQAAD
jgi:hypothetical protein